MDAILRHLAEYAGSLRYEDLPPDVVHAAKRLVIDSVGCAMAAAEAPPAAIAQALAAAARQDEGGASTLGCLHRTTPELAAFANGTMIRYLDLNDTFTGSGGVGHPSDYLAAALAAAEGAGRGGRAVILGLVLAYEVYARMTDAAALGHRLWDQPVFGVMASAAAAARIMELPQEATAHAISLAVVANVALEESRLGTVSMWKGCAAANASRNGVFAARLAAAGMTGPGEVFTGRGGFCAALGCRLAPPSMGGQAGKPFAISDSHLKRYPAGFFSQTAIDAAVRIRPRLGSIERVRLGTFPYGQHVMAGDPEKWRPRTRETADHSLPYVVGVALLDGDVTAEGIERHLGDPRLDALLERLAVEVDPACAAAWPGAAMTRLTVETDGRTEQVEVRHHRGHAANPMTDDEVAAKYRGLGAPEALLPRLWHLEDETDLRGLIALTRLEGEGAQLGRDR
jgi:2-methylcitrate dehydratase